MFKNDSRSSLQFHIHHVTYYFQAMAMRRFHNRLRFVVVCVWVVGTICERLNTQQTKIKNTTMKAARVIRNDHDEEC